MQIVSSNRLMTMVSRMTIFALGFALRPYIESMTKKSLPNINDSGEKKESEKV